jgi:hypothetical protein
MAILPVSNVRAVGFDRLSFEQQVRESDLVVLARLEKDDPREVRRLDPRGQMRLAKMRVRRVLKGDGNLQSFHLVIDGSMVELRPDCCTAGKTYLLLLKHGRDDLFEVVNGRFSAIPVR